MGDITTSDVTRCLPAWVPDAVTTYLAHTAAGASMRTLARQAGCHPSTVMRQVRRIEVRRDDRLVDAALQRLSDHITPAHNAGSSKETTLMIHTTLPDETEIEREFHRVLRRMAESGACLALADGLENAVVVREGANGATLRTAIVARFVAEAMALRDLIAPCGEARVLRYRITAQGRAALKRLIAGEESRNLNGAGQTSAFGDQHRTYGERTLAGDDGKRRRIRYNMSESPLLALSRRRGKDGQPFLNDALVAAGERLREDFELAQMGPRITQNWEKFLTGGHRGTGHHAGGSGGAEGARDRVMAALTDLGPGLGDMALRCCCFLEGLEAAEKRMGWSARSGKIVLRIALQRLRQHYEEASEGGSRLIG
ncbi:MAG: DUF6456 domain-containing protein [Pseudomonadota bacterium]